MADELHEAMVRFMRDHVRLRVRTERDYSGGGTIHIELCYDDPEVASWADDEVLASDYIYDGDLEELLRDALGETYE